MAFEDRPTPADYPAIARIARDTLKASDPSDTFDGTDLINKIEAGQRAMVIRESGWQHAANKPLDTEDSETAVVAFAIAQDRAAGRVNGLWGAQRGNEYFVAHAARCLQWIEKQAREISASRGEDEFIIVTEVGSQDIERHDVLDDAGFERARTWIVMEHEVSKHIANAEPSDASTLSEVITTRPILTKEDKQEAYRVLESSFQDHFNYYPETFEEWAQRIELFPGHQWEDDFLAEISPCDLSGSPLSNSQASTRPVVIGALVNGWLPESRTALAEYLGVSKEGRGNGAAKALLKSFFKRAHEKGYLRAELDVDADSPTGANAAYEKMGWREDYRKESWHKTVTL